MKFLIKSNQLKQLADVVAKQREIVERIAVKDAIYTSDMKNLIKRVFE